MAVIRSWSRLRASVLATDSSRSRAHTLDSASRAAQRASLSLQRPFRDACSTCVSVFYVNFRDKDYYYITEIDTINMNVLHMYQWIRLFLVIGIIFKRKASSRKIIQVHNCNLRVNSHLSSSVDRKTLMNKTFRWANLLNSAIILVHLQLGVERLQSGAGLLQAEGVPTQSFQLLLEVLARLLGLGQARQQSLLCCNCQRFLRDRNVILRDSESPQTCRGAAVSEAELPLVSHGAQNIHILCT